MSIMTPTFRASNVIGKVLLLFYFLALKKCVHEHNERFGRCHHARFL